MSSTCIYTSMLSIIKCKSSMWGYLCDNIGLMLACLLSGITGVTGSPSRYMTQLSGIPILSPVLFMHVGDPYLPPFYIHVYTCVYLFLYRAHIMKPRREFSTSVLSLSLFSMVSSDDPMIQELTKINFVLKRQHLVHHIIIHVCVSKCRQTTYGNMIWCYK